MASCVKNFFSGTVSRWEAIPPKKQGHITFSVGVIFALGALFLGYHLFAASTDLSEYLFGIPTALCAGISIICFASLFRKGSKQNPSHEPIVQVKTFSSKEEAITYLGAKSDTKEDVDQAYLFLARLYKKKSEKVVPLIRRGFENALQAIQNAYTTITGQPPPSIDSINEPTNPYEVD